jgi:hypothetical protein
LTPGELDKLNANLETRKKIKSFLNGRSINFQCGSACCDFRKDIIEMERLCEKICNDMFKTHVERILTKLEEHLIKNGIQEK